jgi:hypothetical protein
MNARYRLGFSWFAVLVAAQALVMGTFLTPLPVSAAETNFCSKEAGFVLVRIANTVSAPTASAVAPQEYDAGYAAFVLAKQASQAKAAAPQEYDAGYAAFVLAKQASQAKAVAPQEYDAGYAAFVLAKQANQVKSTDVAYQSSFSPDAGFTSLYYPLASQSGVTCYVP